jgi:hypothetical protein
MKKRNLISTALMGILISLAISTSAEIVNYDKGVNYAQYIRRDRYLDAEIWTDDDEYYEGDKIRISFRANKDCFVAIYNIDTRGRVNLIYPVEPGDAPRIQGGRIYQIPDSYDDYELTVQGPTGTEYLQIVASSDPFPMPRWFDGSGLICDNDPFDFLDYINASYFGCGYDCIRALDMTSFEVKEWHQYYFRPVYNYDCPDWSLCGSVYIDYPFGATIYIDGIYWGVAPLFIPRVYYGYHYITIYDHYGYCWEDRVNVVRYKSIILDQAIVKPNQGIKSRYRDVIRRGYVDPEKNGYPEYKKEVRIKETYKSISRQKPDYSNDKTRTVYKERSYNESKQDREAYRTHQKTQDRDNSSGKSRSGELKVEKVKTATKQSEKSGSYNTDNTEKKTSEPRNGEVKTKSTPKQASPSTTKSGNSGRSREKR